MRQVVANHSYLGPDGAEVSCRVAFKVGLKGHSLIGLDAHANARADAASAVCAPAALREIELPIVDPKKAAQVVPFEVDGKVVYDIDESVVTHERLSAGPEGCRFLVAVAPVAQIGELLAEDDAQVILPEPFALFTLARNMVPERDTPLLFMDVRAHRVLLVQARGGVWQGSRTLSLEWDLSLPAPADLTARLGRVAQSLWVASGEQPEAVVVLGADAQGEALAAGVSDALAAALNLPRLPVSDFEATLSGRLGGTIQAAALSTHGVALGLGLAAMDGKRTLNLRGGPFALAQAAQGEILKQMVGLGVGVLLVLALFWGNAWIRHSAADAAFGESKAALVAQYKVAFPDAAKVVDPVKQAKAKLKQIQSRGRLYGGDGMSVLGHLNAVSGAIPKSLLVDVYAFTVEGTRLRMEAEAASFDAIDQIKAHLAKLPGIAEVRVSDAKMNAKGKRVKFRVNATLKEAV